MKPYFSGRGLSSCGPPGALEWTPTATTLPKHWLAHWCSLLVYPTTLINFQRWYNVTDGWRGRTMAASVSVVCAVVMLLLRDGLAEFVNSSVAVVHARNKRTHGTSSELKTLARRRLAAIGSVRQAGGGRWRDRRSIACLFSADNYRASHEISAAFTNRFPANWDRHECMLWRPMMYKYDDNGYSG